MSPAPPRVSLDAPLPAGRAEARAILDAACLALWGGAHWTKRERAHKRLPESWRMSIIGGSIEKRARG